MACCHKVVLLVDTAGDAARHSPARRAALRLLTYLSCRFGLARVHWAFKFFDSQGARSRPSRVSDFRELGSRSWEDFEEELEARLGDRAPGAHLPGPTPRATHTHGALMETLLDYQWDRPEITSPTKPILRGSGRRLLDADSEAKEAQAALGGFGNAVFLLAPCPHSQRELLQFVSGCEAQAQRVPLTPKQVMEKVLPKRVQEVMIARNITLYWVDTTERSKLWASPDHAGYWTVCELLHYGGGTILPSETWSLGFPKVRDTVLQSGGQLSHEPHLSPWISALPIDATVNCLLYNSPEYEASFPQTEGTLFLPVKGKETQETWAISLEPLAMHQRHFQKPIKIFLRGSVAQWSLPMSSAIGTDNWMLQSPEGHKSTQRLLFQELVSRLTAEEFHLVASVDPGEGWPPITGIISPFSANAMILTVFRVKEAEFQSHFLQTVVADGPQDTEASLFSDVVDSVLNQVHNLFEDPVSSAPCVPEWVQQELGHTSPWSPALMEKWFPFSNVSGATSDLMESFWLLQAASPDNEESSKTESELTRCLSELYQRKSHEESTVVNQERSRKKRGVPRTPVRQKMKTMSRSLKMLNVARLNVKAQKLDPDGGPDMAVEKGLQKTGASRAGDKSEDRGRTLRSSKLKDFKTEEELLSYIHENYQKAVAMGEITSHSCAQNVVSTIKVFLKSKDVKELEVTCLNHMNSNLLKTSKTLRQNQAGKLDKDNKVRECQLQVFLRLEMCQQCPSVLERTDELEQVVEEVTDLLRMVCLTKDSAYLSEFLEEILRLYIDSIPGTVGQLYHSLGLKIPQKLAEVLPTELFSDDSMTQESKSPPPLSSAHRSVSGITESEQLEELRTRSAKKRRKNALIRHKSIAEISQTLRQIEVPKVSRRSTRNVIEEVTKVPRNLFNQEMLFLQEGAKGDCLEDSVSALTVTPQTGQLQEDQNSTFQASPAPNLRYEQRNKTRELTAPPFQVPNGTVFFPHLIKIGKCIYYILSQLCWTLYTDSHTCERTPRRMTFHPIPPSPPSKLGRLWRKASSPQDFPECQPGPSAAPVLETATSPGAITGSRGQQSQSSEGQSYQGTGLRNDWQVSSPVLIASDTECLPLIEAQLHSLESHEGKSGILSGEDSKGPKTTVADEPPSVSGPRILPPVPSSGSSSPEKLSYTCMADSRQSEAAAQQGSLQASEATGSPQTYEVELEMQASGLPKLRIKKIDPGALLEAEALGKESPLGEEGALPALSMPKANKSSSRGDTYLSPPPCLNPSHSTPGKSGGQTFICQSCTPSRCPPSTPSPFQADVGISWTPSPKQSGKTTPEIIKDWPRRKRAVDCSTGPSGRGEASTDFAGALSQPEPEGKEQGLEHDLLKVLVLEDFELEGVCQLPDQSPPKDSVSKAEEAFSWGQFELGSRKRLLSAKEEAEQDVQRVCDPLSEEPQTSKQREWSPCWSAPPLSSVGEDEVFVSGSTPPSGCTVRSGLSASGLQALTQSPLLFQGRTPSSHSKDTRDEDMDVFPPTTEESPFSQAFSRRRPFRTYTRKKLIS
ncbi:hypothetical protein STEG23_010999 [Scotinomys teguina]